MTIAIILAAASAGLVFCLMWAGLALHFHLRGDDRD
jgi:hypothetical protein